MRQSSASPVAVLHAGGWDGARGTAAGHAEHVGLRTRALPLGQPAHSRRRRG